MKKIMKHYDRRLVTAPQWMEHFQCIAGECPETCCQQWNIEVDPHHADCYTHLGDPELQTIMGHLLRSFRVRRPGRRSAEVQFRLQLLNSPDQRCPILNENGECRLQKKYGPYALCDTCYFHPRTFFQIDEQIMLSACLSCPECARLAILHREPTLFSRFETEIDPNIEWLETSLMHNAAARLLMENRASLISALCEILQERALPFAQRLSRACGFLELLAEESRPDEAAVRRAQELSRDSAAFAVSEYPLGIINCWLEVFDPIPEAVEKPVQSLAEFTRTLAGGRAGYAALLAQNYAEGERLMEPFLSGNEHLIENFMVHCVFSDSFRQFFRCQNEPLTPRDILCHESALLRVWYLFFKVQLAQTSLAQGTMNESLFLQTVIRSDRNWWHYPDWFSRAADRYHAIRS